MIEEPGVPDEPNGAADRHDDIAEIEEVGAADTEDGTVTLRRSTLSRLGVFLKDYDQPRNGFPNRYWVEWGRDLDQMHDDRWLEAIHPDDRSLVTRFVEDVERTTGTETSCRYRVRDAAGEWRWILSKAAVESFDSEGRPLRYMGVDHDVTEMHRLEEELREARRIAEEQAFEAETLRAAGAVIAASLSRNDAAHSLKTHLSTIVPVERIAVFELVDRELVELDAALAEEPFCNGEYGAAVLYEVLRRRAPEIVREAAHAGSFWLVVPIVARNNALGVIASVRRDGIRYEKREIRFAMALADHISLALVNSRLYEEMSVLATTDQLSSLLTRRAFFEHADHIIQKHNGTASYAVLILDIDHFKQINDTYGHLKGDDVIREVARVFREDLRDGDVIGRYGGEEFCALLPGASIQEGFAVAERICEVVRDLKLDRIDRKITVSIGVSSTETIPGSDEAPDLSALLDAADTELYAAKRAGRDRVHATR